MSLSPHAKLRCSGGAGDAEFNDEPIESFVM
jgi:hypothetical protein